jgi:tRNA(fMet)-specific endonuclease VapC
LSPEDIALSTITIAELRHGASNSRHPVKNHRIIDVFSGSLMIEQFSSDAALHYNKIYTALRKKGTTIGQMDCLIGAHALSLDLTLVTNNTKEFMHIPHLKLENWTT